MPTVSEVIETLKKRNQNEVIAFGIWTKKDIKKVAESNNIDLKSDDASDIMEVLTEDFDPLEGINEDVILSAIDDRDIDEDEEEEEEYDKYV